MNYEYSKTLKTYMKAKPDMISRIAVIALTVITVLVSIYFVISDKKSIEDQKADIKAFDSSSTEKAYSQLTPMLLSEAFASNYNDKIYYCLAVDKEFGTYVVAIKADELEQYRELIDYTYDDSILTQPAQVTLEGVPREIEEDLAEFIIEAYHYFLGDSDMNSANYKTIVGSYYLDTTAEPASNSGSFLIFVVIAAILVLLYARMMVKAEKPNKLRKATLNRFDGGRLAEVDRELNTPGALHLKTYKVHFTDNYIVSGAIGLDIIRYDEIKQVYGAVLGKAKSALVAVTRDDVHHQLAIMKEFDDPDAVTGQIVERIKQSAPEAMYGVDEDEFYITAPENQFDLDTATEGQGGKSNILLGIIGAIIGAALGGIIWIAIGEFGFIAGLAGYLMMLFSIKGYQILSGFLDKKGQIISLIIAFVMIFVANYMSYALSYLDYFYDSTYSYSNIVASIKEVPEFLQLDDIKGSFLRDLGIGYLLSIWAGYRLIVSVLRRNKNNEDN